MIYLGADHGGYRLKEMIERWLTEWREEYEDLGAQVVDDNDDYPVYVAEVANRVSRKDDRSKAWKKRAKGVLVCRSGGGMVIGANRFPNVRAVYVFDEKSARHARTDNDANIISLAGDWVDEKTAKEAVRVWLSTEYTRQERHERRIQQLEDLRQ